MLLTSLLVLAVAPFVHSASLPVKRNELHDHSHVEQRQLPNTWYQPRGHPAHELFKRGTDDGVTRPAVGTPQWSAPYPVSTPAQSQTPQPWVDAYNAAVTAGKIPKVPVSQANGANSPTYPPGINPNSPDVCSATYKCVNPGDIWDAPDGVFASAFDDGPYPTTTALVTFLQSQNVTTTHFMIGINILNNPTQFLQAFQANGDIAVHTWTHPYMTTLSDLDVVAQLGWTMQIIHESTGGRVPRYWRPPYGDSDNRVRAIAQEVFGLETVIWNNDSQDWRMGSDGVSLQSVEASLAQWISGPKSPGLVILEHEINADFVTAFVTSFPLIGQNGWKFQSLASSFGDSPYLNAGSSLSNDVKEASVIDGADDTLTTSSSSVVPTSTTEPASTQSAATPSGTQQASSTSSGATIKQSYILTVAVSLFGLLAGSLL